MRRVEWLRPSSRQFRFKKKGGKQAIYHEPIGQSYTTESSKWATHTRSWEELNNELSDKLLATLNLSEQGLSKTTAKAIAARSPESKEN
jgi:hypothetical protein